MLNKLKAIWEEFRYNLRMILCASNCHDYRDDKDYPVPMHFYTYTCRHCGKRFEI